MPIVSLNSLLNSRKLALSLGLILLSVIVYMDWQTGPAVSMTAFYMLPIGLFTLAFGTRAGYVNSILSTAVWYCMNLPDTGEWFTWLLVWNAFIRLVTFVILTQIIGVCRNLRSEVEKHVADRTAAINNFTRQLEVAEDGQRRLIAQEIHDSLGQNLSVMKIRLDKLIANSREGAAPLKDLAGMLESVIAQTRSLTFDLHPSMLYDLGIVPTLRHFAAQCAAHSALRITVTESGQPQPLPPHAASIIFRAVKELTINALKHASASEILISVIWRAQSLRIVVDDDGSGLVAESAAHRPEGLGLRWIRRQLDDVHGSMQIESEVGGTRFITEWPLMSAAIQEAAV